MTNQEIQLNNNEIKNSNQLLINSEVIRVKHIRNDGGLEQVSEYEKRVEIVQNIEEIGQKDDLTSENINTQKEENNKKELTYRLWMFSSF